MPVTIKARSQKAIVIGGSLLIASGALFFLLPQIDLAFSKIFFRNEIGIDGRPIGFWLNDHPALDAFFVAVDWIARTILLGLVILLIYRLIRRHQHVLSTAIITISLVVGPLLMVNTVFKDHWDRARPREVEHFGGEKKFSPAWIISDQCEKNCSFTSGHAAAGFAFVVVYFVGCSAVWLWLGIAAGLTIGVTRVAVGAHFLSDVVFSFFAVYLSAAVIAWAFTRLSRGLLKRN